MTPIDPTVEALVCRLDDNLREAFEERAGVRQFEAGHARELAEPLALLDVIRMNPLAVSDVAVLKVQLDGETLFVLTTDLGRAQQHLDDIGAKQIGTADVAEVVRNLGGVAVVTQLG